MAPEKPQYLNQSACAFMVINYMDIVINNNQTPKLVFAHFLMPHPPYLYDENGVTMKTNNRLDICISRGECLNNNVNYLKFLQYANNTTLTLINKLLAANT